MHVLDFFFFGRATLLLVRAQGVGRGKGGGGGEQIGLVSVRAVACVILFLCLPETSIQSMYNLNTLFLQVKSETNIDVFLFSPFALVFLLSPCCAIQFIDFNASRNLPQPINGNTKTSYDQYHLYVFDKREVGRGKAHLSAHIYVHDFNG